LLLWLLQPGRKIEGGPATNIDVGLAHGLDRSAAPVGVAHGRKMKSCDRLHPAMEWLRSHNLLQEWFTFLYQQFIQMHFQKTTLLSVAWCAQPSI